MMKKVEILDCTLRDGGYINDWNFGEKNIKEIIKNLRLAGIQYIECGFLNSKTDKENMGKSLFNNSNNLKTKIITNNYSNLALMLKVDSFDIKKLPRHSEKTVDIIRLSFHKSDIDKAIDYAIIIKEKGYKLFFQPTTINSYTLEEIKELLYLCNEIIKPDAFAIVDTLGVLDFVTLRKLAEFIDCELEKDIKLLLHCHNNMQLAYGNALEFINFISCDRNIIIDATLLGIGRDSGNIPTELIANYLNNTNCTNYNLEKIYSLIMDVMLKIQSEYKWGYSPFYLLNAQYKIHPKYGKFFKEKFSKISLENIKDLLSVIPESKKSEFDIEYACKIANEIKDNFSDYDSYKRLKEKIDNKKVVIVNESTNEICEDKDLFKIGINIESVKNVDCIFIKDIFEYEKIKNIINPEIILIALFEVKNRENVISFKYLQLLINQIGLKTDESVVLLIQILSKILVHEIIIIDIENKKENFKKYRISKIIEQNDVNKKNEIIRSYIDYYNINYQMKISYRKV